MSTAMVAKYGAEALEHLREAGLMLKMVSAMGQLEKHGWAQQAVEWEVAVAQLIGQIECVELVDSEQEEPLRLPLRERIEQYAERHETVYLRVQRKNGSLEVVEYEPYRFHVSLRTGEPYLVCYHTLHDHIERLPLRNIVTIVGEGRYFVPRWDVEHEG